MGFPGATEPKQNDIALLFDKTGSPTDFPVNCFVGRFVQ